MKLNTWNWMFLFSPYIITGVIVLKFETRFWLTLGFAYFFLFFLWGIYANGATSSFNEKTGRSFKTNYGTFHETKTSYYNNWKTSNMGAYIAGFHLICGLILLIVGVYNTSK